MKKTAALGAALFFLFSALASCSDAKASDNDTAIEWIRASDSLNLDDMHLYWQRDNLHFAADGVAKLSMYVAAEPDDNGRLGFQDGQDWQMILETSLGNYALFPRQYVQIGGVSCTVFIDAENVFHVLVTVRQTADYRTYDAIFESEEQAFRLEPIYHAGGINLILDEQ